MDVIAVAAGGGITLVASPRPPNPTSSTHKSAGAAANIWKAAAVITSNNVMGSPAFMASICAIVAFSMASDTISPATRNRSLNRIRCGEVNTCTRHPAASPIARRKAQVLPLPLVPATWMTGGRRRSGLPSLASSPCRRSRLRSISLGCSEVRRASTGSVLSLTPPPGGPGHAAGR